MKKPPKPFLARFENTMGNLIFNFFCCWSNCSEFFLQCKWTFSFQNCFPNLFWTLGCAQTENTCKYVFAYFQYDHFPKFQNWVWKQFWNKKVNIFIFLNQSNLTSKVENWICHFFLQILPTYLLNSLGGRQTSDFDFTHLSEYPSDMTSVAKRDYYAQYWDFLYLVQYCPLSLNIKKNICLVLYSH